MAKCEIDRRLGVGGEYFDARKDDLVGEFDEIDVGEEGGGGIKVSSSLKSLLRSIASLEAPLFY